jgi:hypothetical protein
MRLVPPTGPTPENVARSSSLVVSSGSSTFPLAPTTRQLLQVAGSEMVFGSGIQSSWMSVPALPAETTSRASGWSKRNWSLRWALVP